MDSDHFTDRRDQVRNTSGGSRRSRRLQHPQEPTLTENPTRGLENDSWQQREEPSGHYATQHTEAGGASSFRSAAQELETGPGQTDDANQASMDMGWYYDVQARQQLLAETQSRDTRNAEIEYDTTGSTKGLLAVMAPFLDDGENNKDSGSPWLWSQELQLWYREDPKSKRRVWQAPAPEDPTSGQ